MITETKPSTILSLFITKSDAYRTPEQNDRLAAEKPVTSSELDSDTDHHTAPPAGPKDDRVAFDFDGYDGGF